MRKVYLPTGGYVYEPLSFAERVLLQASAALARELVKLLDEAEQRHEEERPHA